MTALSHLTGAYLIKMADHSTSHKIDDCTQNTDDTTTPPEVTATTSAKNDVEAPSRKIAIREAAKADRAVIIAMGMEVAVMTFIPLLSIIMLPLKLCDAVL